LILAPGLRDAAHAAAGKSVTHKSGSQNPSHLLPRVLGPVPGARGTCTFVQEQKITCSSVQVSQRRIGC
jgi:hypothetical protein